MDFFPIICSKLTFLNFIIINFFVKHNAEPVIHFK